MVVIKLGLEGFLYPSTGEVEVIHEESSDTEGPEYSICCNCAEGETMISDSLAVYGRSKSVS